MIVLQETDIIQTFACAPRQVGFDVIRVFSEAENTFSDITEFTTTGGGYYINVSAIFDLRENFTYTIKLLSEGTVIFYDKMFCTNQTNLLKRQNLIPDALLLGRRNLRLLKKSGNASLGRT
jgi:hypothetical protein